VARADYSLVTPLVVYLNKFLKIICLCITQKSRQDSSYMGMIEYGGNFLLLERIIATYIARLGRPTIGDKGSSRLHRRSRWLSGS
jgi:hypothetical protein